MRKRLLSLLLALVMTVGIVPAKTYAVEEENITLSAVEDCSIIDNGIIIPKIKISGSINGAYTIIESGLVYSPTNNNPEIGQPGTNSVSGNFSQGSLWAVSSKLDYDTNYYARLYVKTNTNLIIYSGIEVYKTPKSVPIGENIGCTNIVNGGYYNESVLMPYDGNKAFRQVVLDDGFVAYYNVNFS